MAVSQAHRYPSVHLDEEAREEEQHAENNDARRARQHGILEGFHDLTCARREGGRGAYSSAVHLRKITVLTY